MSKIYENSYLTLCIVQGDSCSSGFLKKDYTPPNLKINFEYKLNSAISGHLTLRMLLPPSETVRRCTPEDCNVLSTWYSMIAGYSTRNLTVQHDEFPAISALAHSFAERFPDHNFEEVYGTVLELGSSPISGYWILSGDEHPTSELVIRGTEVSSEKHNPYGRVSKGRLLLTAKTFKPPTQKNGQIRLKHSYKYWEYMNVPSFNYMLRSKKKRFMAKILFDWDSYCAINDNGYPRGPMGDVSLLLTASIFPGDAPMMKSRDLPDDQEMLLGIVVQPSPEEGAYEKLGLWYTEDRENGGRKFWKDVPMQDIILV
ncbi:hypothetical protein AU210_013787 [Fusarium oxysporum f. sp. radicis-cucumerinum]|uniref:Heterokaryon incompatibility domain-containing protein n=1 Tax=Fusarium oxysporum f. sp. radicis-cucumerinum TaxID=327505 RepID=A0A2H3G3N6_FUSOX|nr:hypothetical protein AU210_013787 [Fusarium oxysporum f. sp. radicis-cucumerinum]